MYPNKPPGERKQLDDMFSPEFVSAFRTEFGLTLEDAVDGFGELMDLAGRVRQRSRGDNTRRHQSQINIKP